MKTNHFFAIIVIVIAGFGIYKWFSPKEIQTTRVMAGSAVESIYATGAVETTSMFRIIPKVTARITNFLADEGDKVKKGQKLAMLDKEEALALINERKALVDFYEIELDRAEKLLSQGSGSIQNRDRAKSTFLNAKALLTAAEIEMDEYTIVSPGDCTIIQRDGEIGELVDTAYEIFWLDCSGKYRITAEVDEEDITHVKIGQRVLLRYEGAMDDVHEGVVTFITPRGDRGNRVFRVRIGVEENVPLPFIIGMSVEINIITGVKNDTMLVPNSAIDDGNIWVISQEKTLEKRKVKIGKAGEKRTEILEGVEVGDTIASVAEGWFSEGLRVIPSIGNKGNI